MQTENEKEVKKVLSEEPSLETPHKYPLKFFLIIPLAILFIFLIIFSFYYAVNRGRYNHKEETTQSAEIKESTDSAILEDSILATNTINSFFLFIAEKQFYKDSQYKFGEVKKLPMLWVSDDNWTISIPDANHISIVSPNAYNELNDENSFTRTLLSFINEFFLNNGFEKNSRNTSQSYNDETFYDYIEGYQNDDIRCITLVNPDDGNYQDPDTNEMVPGPNISVSCSGSKYKHSYDVQTPFLRALDLHTGWINIQKEEEFTASGGVFGRRTGSAAFFYKRNGIWEKVWIGRPQPDCSNFMGIDIPEKYLPSCFKSSSSQDKFGENSEVLCSYTSFDDQSKKVVVFETGFIQNPAEVYVTDENLNYNLSKFVAKIGHGEARGCEISSNISGKIYFSFEILGPGDVQELVLADQDGNVISDSLLSSNAEAIGVGSVIHGWYGITETGFLDNSNFYMIIQSDTFGENPENYRVELDVESGKYIEGTRVKL